MVDFVPTFALTSAGARKVMAAAEAEAGSNDWKVTIVVCDAGGTPLLLHRNASAATAEVAMGKARSAALFGKETSPLESLVNVKDGSARTSLLSAPFVLLQGGVPIIRDGACVGAVGVSGVQSAQDEQIARAGVAAVTGES